MSSPSSPLLPLSPPPIPTELTTASTRYFNIPELSTTLAPRLDKASLSSLTRTSRQLQRLFEPWLYHEITLSFSDPNGTLLKSTSAVQALSRNVGCVRWLMCDQEEIGYLFNCLLLHEQQQQAQRETSTGAGDNSLDAAADVLGVLSLSSSLSAETVRSKPQPRQPRWIPRLDTPITPTCIIIPLPPLLRLTYLELNLMPLGSVIHWPQYRQPSSSLALTTLRQTCWIIQQCHFLTGLELVHVPVLDRKEMRLLVGTVCGLRGLKRLHLFVRAEEWVWRGREGLEGVFWGVGEGLEVCKLFASEPMHEEFYLDLGLQEEGQEQEQEQEQDMMDVVNGDDHNENDIVGNENGDDHQDEDIPELIRRQNPLLNLKKLVAWGMEHLTIPEILNIFDHCPNIDRLKVPSVSFSFTESKLTTLAISISDRCPHLRTLSVLDKLDGPLFFRLMETMPLNQLFAVKINNTFDYSGIDHATTRRVFSNHAQSLRVVDLRDTTGMSSKDLVTILEVCAGLEEFKKHPAPNSGDLFITLSDSISVPWACKRIRSLELTIGIPEIKDVTVPYYDRPAPIVLEDQEERLFEKLERFYRQIGSLVMLEHLDLRAVNYDPRHDDDVDGNEGQELDNQSTDEETHINAFPALLSLPSTSSSSTADSNNWPGYLDHLAGWTHLKTLRGSIRLDVGANAATVGEKEIDWFVHHWPALEQVAFFKDEKEREKNEAAPELLLRLREARPRLVLWQ